ncbi:hypothetical protein ACEZ3G_00205 [Maribacter algicola]|uniref:Uncharacterized protein n=1 Tax=Meishania litoralis TaxID=3434685 RepID=A0ACC7LEV7_9FLAO
MSLRAACFLLCLSSSVYYYRPKGKNDGKIIEALDRLAQEHPTSGFRKFSGCSGIKDTRGTTNGSVEYTNRCVFHI